MEVTDSLELLTKSYEKMRLKAGEQEEITVGTDVLEEVDTGGKPSLVGKLFTTRSYRTSALFSHMKSMWDTVGWVRFRELWDDMFLIQFEKSGDRDKVMVEGPWLFSKNILLLQKVEGKLVRSGLLLREVHVWVQLFGLPPLGYTDAMGRTVGSRIGNVDAVDAKRRSSSKGGMKGENYMRVRVLLDVSKPLLRGVYLSVGVDQKRWITFWYERLPNFCYRCGCMGHVMAACQHVMEDDDGVLQYGEWLRSSSDMKSPFDTKKPNSTEGEGEKRKETAAEDSHGVPMEMAKSTVPERGEASDVSQPLYLGGDKGIDINFNIRGIHMDMAFKEWLTTSGIIGTFLGDQQFRGPEGPGMESSKGVRKVHDQGFRGVINSSNTQPRNENGSACKSPPLQDTEDQNSLAAYIGLGELAGNSGPEVVYDSSGPCARDLHVPIVQFKSKRKKFDRMLRTKTGSSVVGSTSCYGKRKAEHLDTSGLEGGELGHDDSVGMNDPKKLKSSLHLQEIVTDNELINLRRSAEGGTIHSRRTQ